MTLATVGRRGDARRRIANAFSIASISLSVYGVSVVAVLGGWDVLVDTNAIYFAVFGVGFGLITWFLVAAEDRNGAVWALSWSGLFSALLIAGLATGWLFALTRYPALTFEELRELSQSTLPLPAGIGLHFWFWCVVPAFWLPLTYGLLLFPDGHAPGRGWRWVGWLSGAAISLATVATAVAQNPWSDLPVKASEDTIETGVGALIDSAFLVASICAVLSAASLVARYRRSDGTTRHQIRWIGSGGLLVTVALMTGDSLDSAFGTGVPSDLVGVAVLSVPIVCWAVAITRYRLYDIDIVISKSVTYLGLAAAISALYAVIVVVPLLIVGLPDEGGPGLALPLAATAVVAVLFEPIRTRMQRWANRLVYGDRATPHEVLSQLTSRLSRTGTDSGTADLARLLGEGTGAEEAVVWLHSDDQLNPDAVWPTDDTAAIGPVTRGDLVDDDHFAAESVRHGDEELGALSITKPHNDPITPADRELLADVAAGAGLMLRNIALNRELEDRAHQVRESRRRLIAAQDAERHRLERDLHDGAQQQVVALKVKLGLAKAVAQREGADQIAELVDGLSASTQDAVDAMRAVAHGIYPPLLEAEGLAVALNAVSRTAPISLTHDTTGLDRFERHVEETVYFCVLEAVGYLHMAAAGQVHVNLTGDDAGLDLIIEHDAPATDLTAVTDRVDAVGGVTHTTHNDGTTRLTCHIPTSEHTLEPA